MKPGLINQCNDPGVRARPRQHLERYAPFFNGSKGAQVAAAPL
jgi:hypothetical protein